MVRYDLCVKSGSSEKAHFENIGLLVQPDNGSEYILLKPWINIGGFSREAGREYLLVSVFDHRSTESKQAQTTEETSDDSTSSSAEVEYGAIPF